MDDWKAKNIEGDLIAFDGWPGRNENFIRTYGPQAWTLQREIAKRWNRAPRAIELLHQVLSFSLCDVNREMEAVLGDVESFLTGIEAEEKGL